MAAASGDYVTDLSYQLLGLSFDLFLLLDIHSRRQHFAPIAPPNLA